MELKSKQPMTLGSPPWTKCLQQLFFSHTGE